MTARRPPSQLDPALGGQTLNAEIVQCLIALYQRSATPAQLRAPDASPLYGDLAGMPPALLCCGTQDGLIDDTMFMASRWQLAGNDVTTLIYPDAPHGCTALPSVEPHWIPRLLGFLRSCLGVTAAAAA